MAPLRPGPRLLVLLLAAPCLLAQAPAPPEEPPRLDTPLNLRGRGLLDLEDPFPLAILHLQLPIDTLEVLKQGEGKLDVDLNWANSFARDDAGTFVVDAETYRLELGGWYALRDDLYVGAALPVHARESGVLDSVVDGFHEAFGFSDGGRSARPKNSYEIRITDQGSERELERGAGLGDLVLKGHWNLNPGDRWLPAVSIQGLVGLPTSTPGFGTEGVDLGMAVSFSKTIFRDFHLYSVVGGTYLTDPRTEGLHYANLLYQATGGIEYTALEDLSFIFQAMIYSPLLEPPSPLDKRRTYLAGGLKWEFLKGFELELSVVENVAPFENSADISFAAGFSFKL